MRAVILGLSALSLAACSQLQSFDADAQVASGLVAKTLCSGVFIQGRDPLDVRAEELGETLDPRLNWFRHDLDAAAGVARASAWGLYRARAVHRPGVGCGVGVRGGGASALAPVMPDPRPWPEGDAVSTADGVDLARLTAITSAAFAEGPDGKARHTRSILIVHRGRLVHERHAPGWTSADRQFGASMSKTVSAALIGVLVGDGRIALDDRDLRPEWTDGRSEITIRHLLQMESGLVFEEDYGGARDPAIMLYASRGAAAYAAAKPLEVTPGGRFAYSSGDTNILMAAARSRSGLDAAAWTDFPRQRLFAPVGMRSAVFEQDAEGDFVGSTFVYASGVDWARFGLLLARDGLWDGRRVLPEGWVGFMSTASPRSGGRYGAQTWLRGLGADDAGRRAQVIQLSGYGGQFVTIHPATETVIVRLGWTLDRSAWNQSAFTDEVLAALAVGATP